MKFPTIISIPNRSFMPNESDNQSSKSEAIKHGGDTPPYNPFPQGGHKGE